MPGLNKDSEFLYEQGFRNGIFSDISIIAFGKQFNLHRIILCNNDYFRKLLVGKWKEKGDSKIELEFDDPLITLEAIQFGIYNSNFQLNLDIQNAPAFLAAASFFDDSELCDIAVEFMTRNLNNSTLVQYLEIADSHYYGVYSEKIIATALTILAKSGFDDYRDALVKIPCKYLEIIKSDAFYVPSEYERYHLLKEINKSVNVSHLFNDLKLYNLNFTDIYQVEKEGKVPPEKCHLANWRKQIVKHKIEKCKCPFKENTETIDLSIPFEISLESVSVDYCYRFCWDTRKGSTSSPHFYLDSYWQFYVEKFQEQQTMLGIYVKRLSTTDEKDDVTCWFQIYCYIGNKCYRFDSLPDKFRVGQSWGWKSHSLYKYSQEHEYLKFAIVIGYE